MFAIVDLETTGGHPENDKIIEIAIILHDGNKITKSFSSLVKPGVPIPPFISRLTKITEEMVERAPSFEELAEKVASMLQNRVFVAHNVTFDYSFLRYALLQQGFESENQLLCTCKTSRKLLPGHPSYSLGRLCRSLSINLTNAHRAEADAKATTLILDMLIEKTAGSLQPYFHVKEARANRSKIPNEQVEKLPPKAGLLYFMDEQGEIIYLIHSKNIRKKAWSIVGKLNNRRFAPIATNAVSVSYTVTGSRIIANIRECEEVRSFQPKYNRNTNVAESRFSIYEKLNANGVLHFEVGLYDFNRQPVVTFASKKEASDVLKQVIADHQLLNDDQVRSLNRELNVDEYNAKITHATHQLKTYRKNFLITDLGPETGQQSIIVVKNGAYAGFLYAHHELPLNNVNEVLEQMQTGEDHPAAYKAIVQHISKGNFREIIHF